MKTIGVRELQQHASRVIREVESGADAYRITLQGRATDVVITRSAPIHGGATLGQLLASNLVQYEHDEITDDLLAMVEAGRDGSGFVGEPRPE